MGGAVTEAEEELTRGGVLGLKRDGLAGGGCGGFSRLENKLAASDVIVVENFVAAIQERLR